MKKTLWLPALFSDHMVLQRELENPVWGKATPGEEVVVSIADQKHATKAGEDGRWCLKLSSMDAGGPHTLSVSSGEEMNRFEDMLVGEVWCCSGQSNMGMPIQRCAEAKLEQVTANYDQIRLITVPKVPSQEPLDDFDGEWAKCTPETVESFAALGYFFGRRLFHALGVPIGLISNSWGGASAEAWMPRDLLEADERYHPFLKEYDDLVATHNEETFAKEVEAWRKAKVEWEASGLREGAPGEPRNPIKNQRRPANLYNGMLRPTIGYGLKGFIWYQGESNTHPKRDYDYRYLFPLLINRFREDWGQGDFPFYWVQLTNYEEKSEEPNTHWPMIRESQTVTLDKVVNGGQAVTIDVGEGRDLHPKNKQTIGDRLARIALARDYGFDLVYKSPRFESFEVEEATATVNFKHVTEEGLYAFDVPEVLGFELAGDDQVFHAATAEITGDKLDQVQVWCKDIPNPVAVRYAWAKNPTCNLYDREGLPVTPFRTDEW